MADLSYSLILLKRKSRRHYFRLESFYLSGGATESKIFFLNREKTQKIGKKKERILDLLW